MHAWDLFGRKAQHGSLKLCWTGQYGECRGHAQLLLAGSKKHAPGISHRLAALPFDAQLVVHCKSKIRSKTRSDQIKSNQITSNQIKSQSHG